MINMGLGDTLYESATIAYDTGRGIYFNPTTNVDYGPMPPTGGWAINWYGTPGNITVPVGQGVIAQTQAQADIIKSQVQAQLTGTGSSVNASTATAPVTTNPTTQPSTGIMDYLQGNSMFGISDLYLAIGVVMVGGFIMFHGHKGRR